jgi:pimeloyl-ACP methyl ester carboxylesterase
MLLQRCWRLADGEKFDCHRPADGLHFTLMTQLNQQMKRPDGRSLAYDDYGPRDGNPIFHFHGAPSSRREWPLFGTEALGQASETLGQTSETRGQALEVRVIVPDRPGMGLSDFQPNRRISDWPQDVAALADHLGLDRFAVVGYSGGGPYAIACALALPDRLTRVALVSSSGPFDQPGLTDGISADNMRFFDLIQRRPWLSGMMLRLMGMTARFAGEKMVAQAMAALPDADRQVVTRPELQKAFLAMLQEGLRQGPGGVQRDILLMTSPWEFRPQDVRIPVRLWHGDADKNAPPAMGRYLAEAIPNSHFQLYPGEGHVSLYVKHVEEILHFLASTPGAGTGPVISNQQG